MTFCQFRAAARVMSPIDYSLAHGPEILALCRVGDRVRAYPSEQWIIERPDGSHWTGLSGRILDTAFADLSLEAIERTLHGAARDQQDAPAAAIDAIPPADRLRGDLESLQALLSDWPTMRALSASGSLRATANKLQARQIVARMLIALAQDAGAAK